MGNTSESISQMCGPFHRGPRMTFCLVCFGRVFCFALHVDLKDHTRGGTQPLWSEMGAPYLLRAQNMGSGEAVAPMWVGVVGGKRARAHTHTHTHTRTHTHTHAHTHTHTTAPTNADVHEPVSVLQLPLVEHGLLDPYLLIQLGQFIVALDQLRTAIVTRKGEQAMGTHEVCHPVP